MSDKSKLISEGWKEHPKYSNYLGNSEGKIYSLLSNKVLNGNNNNGYIKVSLKQISKSYPLHRFIYECYNGKIQEKYQIDHINNNKLDNSINNLQALNAKDHNQKTMTDEVRIKQNESLQKQILIEIYDKKENIIKNYIDTANSLTTKLHISTSYILQLARFNTKYLNYRLSYYEDIIENEIWKKINDEKFKGYEFSNMGRIKNTQNRITYGSHHTTGYMSIHLQYKKYNVHYLICLAFHGNPPGIYNKEYSVDHIDQDKHNNKSENLRWATRIEQANNTSQVRKIKAFYEDTGEEIGIYLSASDAHRQLKFATGDISKACKSGKYYGKINNRKIKWILI
jgi:hypothetical protein